MNLGHVSKDLEILDAQLVSIQAHIAQGITGGSMLIAALDTALIDVRSAARTVAEHDCTEGHKTVRLPPDSAMLDLIDYMHEHYRK